GLFDLYLTDSGEARPVVLTFRLLAELVSPRPGDQGQPGPVVVVVGTTLAAPEQTAATGDGIPLPLVESFNPLAAAVPQLEGVAVAVEAEEERTAFTWEVAPPEPQAAPDADRTEALSLVAAALVAAGIAGQGSERETPARRESRGRRR